jgi:hypothetical protein
MEIIIEQLIMQRKEGEESKGDFDFRYRILTDSNKLSLYLRLKELYQSS